MAHSIPHRSTAPAIHERGTTMEPQTILIVLAHPDDESFPMGGTIAKYASEGAHTTLVCATRGEAGIPWVTPPQVAAIREAELRAAVATLGIAELHFLDQLDGMLFKADHQAIIAQLVTLMQTLQPQVVITFGPDGISGHFDHLVMHELTTVAFDQAQLDHAALYYIAPSEATQQGCGVVPILPAPNTPLMAIDVHDHLVTKARAMQCHASQKPPLSGPPEAVAAKLVCHEYFTLARPHDVSADGDDLFAVLTLVPITM